MTMRWTFALILVGTIAAPNAAQDKRRDDLKKPLVLASQGSFFVGGETKPLSPTPPGGGDSGGRGNPLAVGDITVNPDQHQCGSRGKCVTDSTSKHSYRDSSVRVDRFSVRPNLQDCVSGRAVPGRSRR
jgi:hypothetical protein